MKTKQLRNLISETYLDITFKYKDMYGIIMPRGSDKFCLGYGDITEEYDSLDELMNAPNFDGKSLAEIAADISELEMV